MTSDIKMLKSIGVESIGGTHNVTSSSTSEMDAGDLLSASINSGIIGGGGNIMSTSIMSSASFTSSVSQAAANNGADKQMFNSAGGISITHGVGSSGSPARFPKLEECAHFHYERVQLGRIHIRLIDESKRNDCNSSLITETASCSTVTARAAGENFIMKVSAGRSDPFLIRRSLENLTSFDSILHRCVYDRRISELKDLNELEVRDDEQLEDAISEYLARFSMIASDSITCGSILTWLQLDNKGRRLPVADRDTMLTINTPAVGAAYGVRKYIAQACDEISIDVGDMISVIDMPSPAESVWWRGKKSLAQKNQYEVGFFPQSCVATIGEKVPRNMPLPAPLVGSLALSPTKPVLRKHGKLISFFRSFILARPSRRRLKQSGIYKERVFSCDLSEHLLNSQQDIPMVLKHCAEFIENFGIVDGIYRLSGITSNIQKLRRAFDEERVPDLTTPEFRHDIHAVSSLLKMYFRELPNPLCTYQLYDHFVEAIQAKVENPEEKVRLIKKVVQKLPPPHYRTLKYLAMHLFKISRYGESTGMTERNIAIVWAPNLLRSPALEAGGVAALKGVGVQAVVTEYLISKCEDIFDDSYIPVDTSASIFDDSQPPSLNSVQSAIEIRDHDLFFPIERPKSLNVGGPKLITLEEAQIKQNRVSLEAKALPNPTGLPTGVTSYIEVGGGPASLPDKYHTVLPLPKNKRKSGNSIMALFCRPSKSTSTHNIQSSTTLTTTPENATITTIMKPSRPITLQKSSTVSSPTVAISAPVDMVTSSEDMLDAKTAELLLTKRSNSIDSLRTAGHSRSVSHDSYFDLLQSPLRGFVTMCPSREMSELGMNFDREEADMRIFSESESLVSSPRVAKENARRTTKVRIDDSHGQGNVNPSPKKQPRLNIPNTSSFNGSHHLPVTTPETPEDETYSNKKYKFEDQLNQLQYIDSSTPEHTVPTAATTGQSNGHEIFTSVQVHQEPVCEFERREKVDVPKDSGPFERYSYPYYEATQKETTNVGQNERYSLPPATKMTVDDEHLSEPNVSRSSLDKSRLQGNSSKLLRHSYLEATNSTNDILRQTESVTDVPTSRSKLSINTPQSEQHSPGYSLLMTSTTSSDTSSIIDLCGRAQAKPTFESRPSTLDLARNGINHKADQMSTTTSQSLTPSDIAYSQMQQHANTTEVTPKSDSDNFEGFQGVSDLGLEHAFNTYEYVRPGDGVSISPIKSGPTTPVRATISITYNLKSPVKEMPKPEMGNDYEEVYVPQSNQQSSEQDKSNTSGLLETSFDTNVYEQVKFLKSAVNELNEMIDEKEGEAMETEQEVPDFAMHEPPQDSLELENDEAIKSMYENVTQPKPPAFYENLDYKTEKEVKDGTLRESGYKEMEFKYEVPTKIEIRSSNDSGSVHKKSVRQLANKFETSPIDILPPFDFSQKGKLRDGNLPSPTTPNRIKAPSISKDLSPNITRSLDENAFVREFGSGRKSGILAPVEMKGVLIENNNSSRRKSGDNLKPKMLNQPKKLPGLKQNDPEYCKQSVVLSTKKDSGPPPVPPKITPTTENRISLIQQNFATQSSDDERSSAGHPSSLKMLGSCKLDRDRIERIKEERRNQLQEKFRSESFRTEKEGTQKVKSKSRSDIRETVTEKPIATSLRVKSKSRAELPITPAKISVDGQEVHLRPPSSAARQQQINSLKLDDTKDIKRNSIKTTTTTCDTNKQCDSIGSVGRKSVGGGDLAAKQNKFIMRPTDTSTNSSDRMSIKDVAAMFESKSHTNY